MSDSQSVVIRLIGAGVIARLHAQASAKLPAPVSLFVTDPNPAAVEAFVQQFPHARPCPDLDALLAGPAAPRDIVINATPPAFHAPAAIAALNSGRHVLCEKPLALNAEQARQMLAAARQNDRLLGCCSARFTGLPAVGEVQRLIESNALGRVYHLTFINRSQRARSGVEYQPASRWFLDPRISGGGVLMDWGPYDFTALTELLHPTRVDVRSAWLATPRTGRDPRDIPLETEQQAGANLLLHRADGGRVSVTYERAACTHGEARSILEIEGTEGAVQWQWPGGKGTVTRTFDRGGDVQSEVTQHPDPSGLHPHDKPLISFYRRALGEASPAVVNEQAVFNFSILRALYEVAATGQPQTLLPPA